MGSILRLLRRSLTAAGTILGAAALFALAGAVESLHTGRAEANSAGSPYLGRVSPGDTVARLSVPRLDVEAQVREGVDEATLLTGPGHVPGTAMPGDESRSGNAVIAMARDVGKPFAEDLALGDLIELRTPFGLRSYRVVDRRTLGTDSTALGPTDRASLTLIAPYPSDSIGPAPMRLAVRAELFEPASVNERTRSATRSTGRISSLAVPGASAALPAGR